jgi:restriction system protein
MISRKTPISWQELQLHTSRILSEAGFTTEIEKNVPSARGISNIDVYAEENLSGRKNIILIECKYWKSNVDKSVIHSFRSIIDDIGANSGIIVTMNGFQRGSFEASQFSNVELVTWSEFQDMFLIDWYQKYFKKQIDRNFTILQDFLDPLEPRWVSVLNERNK